MEQKKILWIVVFISAFILVILGVALYMYAPFRNKSTMEASEIYDLGKIQNTTDGTKIDPVQWSRNPDSIPPLETEANPPINITNNNYTYVNGESAPTNDNKNTEKSTSIDVTNLTENRKKEEKVAPLPGNLLKDVVPEQKKKTDSGVIAKKGTLKTTKTEAKKDNNKNIVTKATTVPKTTKKSTIKKTPITTKKTSSIIYWVQTASLTSRINAENARARLSEKHMNAEIFIKETAFGVTHRVRVGPFKNKTEADYWVKKVRDIKGFEGSYVLQDTKKI